MAWYNTSGPESDVVISSRIRFARNLAGYPFTSRLNEQSARNVIIDVTAALTGGDKRYKIIDFSQLAPSEARSYVENHSVSPEFIDSRLPRALITDADEGVAVMICEEDHIRLQVLRPGFALREAYDKACELDDRLSMGVDIAWDENLGYLTHCPTNLGTGMRASVMMFLPAMTLNKQIGALAASLGKLGLTMRGLYGEGSEADGFMYQISNQVTLGITEENTLKKLSDVVSQIISRERQLRASMMSDAPDRITDTVMRSVGALRYAHMMSSEEFLRHFAYVRLGISLGIVKDITYEKLGNLLVDALPATLTLRAGHELSTTDRDLVRAKYVRENI
jgi:protein arginine kinase